MCKFIFQPMQNDGMPLGLPVTVKTVAGVILQCPPTMNPSDIRHLCELARATPGHPVDITAWEGPDEMRHLTWSARISYLDADVNTGEHRILMQAE